jgi:hypothetical protein
MALRLESKVLVGYRHIYCILIHLGCVGHAHRLSRKKLLLRKVDKKKIWVQLHNSVRNALPLLSPPSLQTNHFAGVYAEYVRAEEWSLGTESGIE